MHRSALYALAIALPPALAGGFAILMYTGSPLFGVGFAVLFGGGLFAILFAGREYGSTDGRSVGEL